MNARRIAFVAPSAYPLGGVAVWLDYLVTGLQRLGWDPLVLLAAGEHHDARAYLAAHPQLPAVAVNNATGSRQGRIDALREAFVRARPRIVAGVNIPDAYAAACTMPDASIATVMTLHGVQPDLFEDVSGFRDCLDAVVVTNRLTARLCESSGMPPDRVFYAPYGVPLPGTARPESGAALRIAFVGRLEAWQKRIFDLPPICDELQAMGVPFELVIAGAGPDEARLRERLRPHEAAGRVKFLGAIEQARLHEEVYSRCDVLLITSSWETGPIVAWEAMACGVAVVSSRYVGCGLEGALADAENCLLFPVGDCAGAARALAAMQDKPFRSRIAQAGARLVHARYTQEASIAAWNRAFCAIDSLPARPRQGSCGPKVEPAGRLDRWLGTRWGETLRKSMGRGFAHAEAGGEWPHSYGERPVDDESFWIEAARADKVPA